MKKWIYILGIVIPAMTGLGLYHWYLSFDYVLHKYALLVGLLTSAMTGALYHEAYFERIEED